MVPTFIRALNDWEIEEMTRFFHILHDQQFRPTGVDKLALQNVKDRGFSVKSMYKGVDVSPPFVFPHRIVWNSVVSPKIGVFAWEAAWGKVLTLDQLKLSHPTSDRGETSWHYISMGSSQPCRRVLKP